MSGSPRREGFALVKPTIATTRTSPVARRELVAAFLQAAKGWGEERSDILGIALVGSHARGASKPDSDVDLVVLCESPAVLLRGDWPSRFGAIQSATIEDYGALKSRRVFYRSGLEVEFGIAGPSWADAPLDAGTRKVLADGARVLYDPSQLIRVATESAAAGFTIDRRH